MKILVDTNIILDVWLAREPFWRDSAKVLGLIEQNKFKGIISPTTVTTLHYLSKKKLGEKKARELIKNLLKICTVGKVMEDTFHQALDFDIPDFEDAVLSALARDEHADYIATRNIRDFRKSPITAKEPAQLT
ncbi:MAG: PIN domain-containing protein [Puniceicoccaceae bacterium]